MQRNTNTLALSQIAQLRFSSATSLILLLQAAARAAVLTHPSTQSTQPKNTHGNTRISHSCPKAHKTTDYNEHRPARAHTHTRSFMHPGVHFHLSCNGRSLTGIPPSIYRFTDSASHSSFSPVHHLLLSPSTPTRCQWDSGHRPFLFHLLLSDTRSLVVMQSYLLDIKRTTCPVIKFVAGKLKHLRKRTRDTEALWTGRMKRLWIETYYWSQGRGFTQEVPVIGNFTYYVINSCGVLSRDRTPSWIDAQITRCACGH